MIEFRPGRKSDGARVYYSTHVFLQVPHRSILGILWIFASAYVVEVGVLLPLVSAAIGLVHACNKLTVSLEQQTRELESRDSWTKTQLDAILGSSA